MTEMVLPQFGMGMADGTILVWHKAVGDAVRQGEPLCDVEAAKTTVEVGAPCNGVLLQILVPGGTNVPVNTVIAVIGEAGAVPITAEPVRTVEQSSPAPMPEPVPAPVPAHVQAQAAPPAPRSVPDRPGKGPQIEPRARRAARDRGLDLAAIQGSGPGGRIVEEDVLRALQPVAPSPVAAPASLPRAPAPVFQILRMRCDARPLAALLDAVAAIGGVPIPLRAVIVKAVALALIDAGRGDLPLCVRSDDGGLLAVGDPVGLGASAIEARLAPVVASEACLVIEPLADAGLEHAGLEDAGRFDASCAASLSVSTSPADELALALVVSGPAMPYADARRVLGALRDRIGQPLAILA